MPLPLDVLDLLNNWHTEPALPWPMDGDYPDPCEEVHFAEL